MQRSEEAAAAGPRTDDPEGVAQLRDVLDAVGFTVDEVRAALTTDVSAGRDSLELPLYVRLLPPDAPLSTLIKLFLLGASVAVEEAARALAPLPLERLERMGVLSVDLDRVRPELELIPTEELLIACDSFLHELTRPDHVLGVSPPAKVLAALTVREPVESALDVGTGNGIQALLAARRAERVTAVDLNPRALRFAAFNALLNRVPPLDLREGSLFEPVEGESFDLVVCNPPYVISPESELSYRDSGVQGDAFCEQILRQLPSHLREGGFGHVLVSWIHAGEEDWSEPLRRWVEGSGCDALLLRYTTHDLVDYAAGWNRPLRVDAAAYGAALDRWAAYYERLGIETISWGAIVLRRRAGNNWVWAHTPTSHRVTGSSDQVLRLFAAQDFLAALPDGDALLDRRLALAPEHRLDQTGRIVDGERAIERSVLRLERGLRFEVAVDGMTVDVLSLLGSRRVRDVLAEAAAAQGVPPDAFVAGALPVVTRLVELGFLLPVDEP